MGLPCRCSVASTHSTMGARDGAGATTLKKPLERAFAGKAPVTLTSVPDALVGKVLADLASTNPRIAFVARDGQRLAGGRADDALLRARRSRSSSFRPGTACPTTASRRMRRSSRAAWRRSPPSRAEADRPQVVLTTVNAALQRVPTREFIARGALVGGGRQPDPHGRARPLAGGQRLPALDHGARAGRIRRARRHPRPLRRRCRGAGPARFLRRHAGIDPQFRSGQPAHDDRAGSASTSSR